MAVSQPEDLQITAESSHHRRAKILVEGNAENEICKSENKPKCTKKRRSTSKERKEEAPSPFAPPPKTEKEEKNRQGTRKASPEDEKIGSNAIKASNKRTNESQDKREERNVSAEKTAEAPPQVQEEQETRTKISEERKSLKGDKRKSSKKHLLTVNEEDKTNDTKKNEQKENTKNETATSDTKEDIPREVIQVETDTKVTDDLTSTTSKILQNDKAKKSKKSRRDKESRGKSRKHKEATKSPIIPDENAEDVTGISGASNTNAKVTKFMDESKLVKDVQGLAIDLKPPSEFQDSSVNSTA
ncbi:uncharacterized protein AH6.3-like [Macrobrachium rosenbergii]|uniref:uncharacterized protein AH6.3-like n=1 Tax=Macrobrachium rosenbergii TaxID=79674 RepID=UPI0034D67795